MFDPTDPMKIAVYLLKNGTRVGRGTEAIVWGNWLMRLTEPLNKTAGGVDPRCSPVEIVDGLYLDHPITFPHNTSIARAINLAW